MTKPNLKDNLQKIVSEESKVDSRHKILGSIAELLEKKNIDISEIGDIKKVSIYQSLIKDENGDAQIHDLTAIQFSPSWEEGPKWPVVQQGPQIQLQKTTTKPKEASGFKTCVVVPDIQFGFYRNFDGTLEPTHDEKCISILISMIKSIKPDIIVCVGDNLDLPEMGKYVTYPAYAQTTQASIDRATMFCAQMRNAAPDSRIVWLAGNHEERMPKYLVQNAGAAYGLRKGNTPESWPVLSVPYLCRMDEYKIEYKPGYPAADFWINNKLRIIHGDRVKSGGSTAHVYLNNEKTSVIYGHIHRIETAFKTREDFDGPRTIMAASPGCLARIDGAIPSTRGGVDLDGRPLTRYENWQQGVGIVTYEDDNEHKFSYEVATIYDGWTMFRGKEYKA
ncbi:Calcineurin-like phosphoesterase domain, ApaH type [uncultured Caudovirales phage]|uniref:Calcineurin-like phosphoesterase domain, ApaH type n=1 Tax=uncultured Caudovirales phage TaxID=2100421 RepID=A0A6J5NCY2_9CAUD|nr:Calcineurin-like phosphoesterase domain, ApaH type [uncultured Caudovirales phage]